jgi:hypothetical protein
MKTTPRMLQKADEDAEAQEEADEAVEQGTTLIRSHLSNHIAENPGSSFVTWIATLHPENADVTIDQRFLIPGNPWWTVYEEACCKHNEYPTATAVPVVGDEEQEGGGVSTTTNNTFSSSRQDQPHFCYRCSPIDIILGFSLALSAFLTVGMMEFFAVVVYTIGAVFFHMATALAPPNLFTGLFYSLFMLLYYGFALVDSILLVTSIFVIELLAAISFILTMCFGVNVASSCHQYIRRTCHLARWAYRSPFTSPPRQILCQRAEDNDDNQEKEQATMKTGVVPPSPHPTIVVLDEKDIMVTGTSSKSTGSSTKSLI